MKNYEKYLTLSYKENGYGEDGGVACYGLCVLIRKELFNKHDDPIFKQDKLKDNINNCSKADKMFKRLNKPEEGCFILMKSDLGHVSHVGLYIGEGMMIDADDRDIAVKIDEVPKNRVIGFYD